MPYTDVICFLSLPLHIKHLIMNYSGSCRETSDIPMMVKDKPLSTACGQSFWFIMVSERWEVKEERKRWLELIRMVLMALDWSLFLQPISSKLFGEKGSVWQLALPPPSFTSPCTSSNYSLQSLSLQEREMARKKTWPESKGPYSKVFCSCGQLVLAKRPHHPIPTAAAKAKQLAKPADPCLFRNSKAAATLSWPTLTNLLQYNFDQIYSFSLHRLLYCAFTPSQREDLPWLKH